MNLLELKGSMTELIGQTQNKILLQHLYEIMLEVLANTNEDTLSPEQEGRLDKDIKESKDPQKLVDHEVAIKKMNNWLKK